MLQEDDWHLAAAEVAVREGRPVRRLDSTVLGVYVAINRSGAHGFLSLRGGPNSMSGEGGIRVDPVTWGTSIATRSM